MKDSLFFLGLGTLFTHELDAMLNHEWRVLPILRSLPEDLAVTIFVAVHVPLVAAIVALVANKKERVRNITRIAVSIFLLIHCFLHLWFSDDSNYEFASALSAWLIFGGAAFGAAVLMLDYTDARSADVP